MDGVTDQDFNASSGNFGGDLQSLEERGLFWTQGGGLSRHMDIQGRKGTCLGWGFHLKQWGIQLIYQRTCHKTRKHTSIADKVLYQEKILYCFPSYGNLKIAHLVTQNWNLNQAIVVYLVSQKKIPGFYQIAFQKDQPNIFLNIGQESKKSRKKILPTMRWYFLSFIYPETTVSWIKLLAMLCTYFSSNGFLSMWPLMAFLIMVFFPIKTTAKQLNI